MRRLRSRPASTLPARRAHADAPPARATESRAPAPSPRATHGAERRLRASGGPEDRATYACRCGAVFPAAPTTSVACPLCGIQQAW